MSMRAPIPGRACRALAVAALMLVAVTARPADNKHLGVGSCGSGVCHGKLKPVTAKDPGGTARVALNEYRRWLQEDRHSQAYNALNSPLGQSIAAKMGIGNPTSAAQCIDCHADNVPKSQRGPLFRIEDGVGCEACHGGSEQWIKSHASNTVKHESNLAAGMTPTHLPVPRATLCLTCHLGTPGKFANHAMMGAGHPRLSFELETFVYNQPAHYVVDADYIERKGSISGMTLWVTGQLTAAKDFLALLKSPIFRATTLYPEFAAYDCDSCHHTMNNVRWTRQRVGEGVKTGSLRLQTQNFLMLQAAAQVIDPASVEELKAARNDLIRAGQTDLAALSTAVERCDRWLGSHKNWSERQFSAAEAKQVRQAVLGLGAADDAFDYLSAEQVVFSVQSLSFSLGDYPQRKPGMDLLFAAVKSEYTFNPSQFAQAAKSAQAKF